MNRAVRRHPLALTLAVVAAASLVACTATTGADPGRSQVSPVPADPATRPELKSFYGQKLKWTPCGDLQCARLTVPMDYAHPANGKTFVLPVARAATADRSKRIGSLVYNPGGPGVSGISDLKSGTAETFSAEMRDRFDVVSFDPRGVGASKPALKCTEDEAGGDGADDGDTGGGRPLYPRTEDDRAAALAGARLTATGCKKGSGAILPHVGTQDAARDMDVLRAALGDPKLSYLGWSYGTSLGTTYAEQFPRRVRALVLDGAIDPSLDWSKRAVGQAAGFDRAVDDYTTYCADVAGDSCPGETPEQIRQLIDRLYDGAGREPLPVDGDDYGLDARGVLDAVSMAMYTPEAQWEDLSAALREADDGDGTKLAGLDGADEPESDSEDSSDSSDSEALESADPTENTDASEESGAEPPADNEDAALLAVSCIDTPHPRSAEPYWDAFSGAEKTAGVYGPASVIDALACKDWPAGTQRPHKVRAEGVPPVLVVGTTGDPATPYEEAESLAAQFPGGMLLTYEGLGHTAYGRSNTCVTKAVDGYLIGLKPVRSDTTC